MPDRLEACPTLARSVVTYEIQALAGVPRTDYSSADGGQTPASLGWTLTSAIATNDAGVVGYGSHATGNTSWIIYPKCMD